MGCKPCKGHKILFICKFFFRRLVCKLQIFRVYIFVIKTKFLSFYVTLREIGSNPDHHEVILDTTLLKSWNLWRKTINGGVETCSQVLEICKSTQEEGLSLKCFNWSRDAFNGGKLYPMAQSIPCTLQAISSVLGHSFDGFRVLKGILVVCKCH